MDFPKYILKTGIFHLLLVAVLSQDEANFIPDRKFFQIFEKLFEMLHGSQCIHQLDMNRFHESLCTFIHIHDFL